MSKKAVLAAILTIYLLLALNGYALAAGFNDTQTMAAGEGRIIYVNCNATGDNTGSSWGNAFTTLQAALDTAQPGDEIWVATGTYKPTSEYGWVIGERGKHFEMKNGVGIYGGFAGTESMRSGRDWTEHPTILSGDIGNEGDDSDNCYHVFYHPGDLALDQTAVLDGFTVTEGNANYSPYSPPYQNPTFNANGGGGMYNENSSPKLINVTFSGNSAYEYGGGMYNHYSSNPTLTNVTFSNNSNDYVGGMANVSSSSPTLTNCILWGKSGVQIYNTANDSSATVTYSNIQDGYPGNGNIDANPLFVGPGNLRDDSQDDRRYGTNNRYYAAAT